MLIACQKWFLTKTVVQKLEKLFQVLNAFHVTGPIGNSCPAICHEAEEEYDGHESPSLLSPHTPPLRSLAQRWQVLVLIMYRTVSVPLTQLDMIHPLSLLQSTLGSFYFLEYFYGFHLFFLLRIFFPLWKNRTWIKGDWGYESESLVVDSSENPEVEVTHLFLATPGLPNL